MNYIKSTVIAAATILCVGCNNFTDINTNPDSVTKVNSKLLATGAIAGIMKSGSGPTFVDHMFITKYLAWGEGARGAQYNDFYRTSFDSYVNLLDYKLMAELAPEESKNAYEGLALFLKSYVLFDLTMSVGDIPYSDILQGEEGFMTPKYDSQKDVCLFILQDLEQAYAKMSQAKNFEGDFIFSGDTKKWEKVITALQLRTLMHLSIKENDPDLKIIDRFKKVFQQGALMESNEDNLQLTYSNAAGQLYPYHSSGNKHWAYAMLSDYLVKMLKENEDYRLFYYGRPAQSLVAEGISSYSWDAFMGVDPTAPISEVKDHYAEGSFSGLNERYINYAPGEPFIRLGYAEQKFILAEAALRGWIDVDANELYKEGIKASMEFISSNTPDEDIYHYGHLMTETYIQSFIEKPSIQLQGDFDHKLEQIMKQKYIASFMQLPYQPYYDYRRTGYPDLPINPETSMNFNDPKKLPMRWQYPDTEISYNTKNVEEAIQRQYGSDEVNKLMWILKAE